MINNAKVYLAGYYVTRSIVLMLDLCRQAEGEG